ncbi:MAG: prepilin peptidase [Planctomycetaceae bacterium]
MFLDPNRSFFHVTTEQAGLLTVAAFVVGLVVGMLLSRWTNRVCETPPRPKEAGTIVLLTATLFALATFVIVALEGQRVSEVTPDLAWRYGRWLTHLGLLALLIVATATDLREYVIPDQITLPGIVLGVLLATVAGDSQLMHFWVDWNHPLVELQGPEIPNWLKLHPHWHGLVWSLAGAATGAGVTWLARGISSTVLGQEAMGLGDVTLMALIGSVLGWQPVLFVFVLAPFCGLFVSMAVKAIWNRPYVPYGPYLSVAAVFVMLAWNAIWSWEPTSRVSIRKLFGDLPSLGILAGVSVVLLLLLLGVVRWWHGGPRPKSQPNS